MKSKITKTVKPKPPVKVSDIQKIREFLTTGLFHRIYAFASILILLGTTIYWSIIGARLQQGNSDQLVNPYLFSNSATFHGATFPGQHSFLIKWPLFLLIKLFGYSDSAYLFFTVLVAALTIVALVIIIYRIERRPLIFGTICLALASVLLLIPPVPSAGTLLPVNMAMITTRNLEYIVYIAALALIILKPALKSWLFWIGVVLLSLLIASDKIFMTISIVGAVGALIIYALRSHWKAVELSVHWLIAGVAGTIGGTLVLWLINKYKITRITSQAGAGPYSLVSNSKDFIHGLIYGVLGVMTNFGANPAFDAKTIRSIPDRILHNLWSVAGVGFIVNFILLAIALYAVYKLLKASLLTSETEQGTISKSSLMALALIWSSGAAFLLFIGSSHDYVVDARYLTIVLFALFISLAVSFNKANLSTEKVTIGGLIIVLGILSGIFGSWHIYQVDQQALNLTENRDKLVASDLSAHKVDVLVGDYWRVIPIKQASNRKLNVTPLTNCVQASDTLSSSAWQPDLKDHSFAYLISFSGNLTNFPNCQLEQVIQNFGQPNNSIIVAGSYLNPKEELLIYDKGEPKKPNVSVPVANDINTLQPITLSQLANTKCSVPTSLNIVAHEDDDILFMNPDIENDIKAGDCIRTVYITAGDDGASQSYWLARQQGAEAAYSYMIGQPDSLWIHQTVQLNPNEYITVASPQGNDQISLIFMNLPDGDITGSGFPATGNQSLQKLFSHQISLMNTVDSQSSYSYNQLIAALENLMITYSPSEIKTQADYVSTQYPDHSDHIAVGNFVKQAYQEYETEQYNNQVTIPIKFYIGYPIHGMPANVSGSDLANKEAAFLAYTAYDGAVCRSLQSCLNTPTYGSYLTREYQYPD